MHTLFDGMIITSKMFCILQYLDHWWRWVSSNHNIRDALVRQLEREEHEKIKCCTDLEKKIERERWILWKRMKKEEISQRVDCTFHLIALQTLHCGLQLTLKQIHHNALVLLKVLVPQLLSHILLGAGGN